MDPFTFDSMTVTFDEETRTFDENHNSMSLDLENINLGATAGDKTGDGARTGGGKINRN